MATKHELKVDSESRVIGVPPLVEGGTDYFESLGGWVDRLLGDSVIERRVRKTLVASDDDAEDESTPIDSDDLPETESPPPVEGGTDIETKGGDEERHETRSGHRS